MGTSSKAPRKTDEEIAKELEDARRVTLTSAGGLGSSMQEIGTNGANSYGGIQVGNEFIVRNDGDREYIDIGGAKAYWDPDRNTWAGSGYDSAGGNHRAASFNTVDVPVVQAQSAAAPAGAPPPSNKPPKDWRDNIDNTIHPGSVGSSPGLETSGIVDTTGMDNFMGSMAATPGAVVNPNVDPNNWMYQVNPEHQIARNVGVYKNPAIDDWLKNSQKGLLSASGGMV